MVRGCSLSNLEGQHLSCKSAAPDVSVRLMHRGSRGQQRHRHTRAHACLAHAIVQMCEVTQSEQQRVRTSLCLAQLVAATRENMQNNNFHPCGFEPGTLLADSETRKTQADLKLTRKNTRRLECHPHRAALHLIMLTCDT